MNGPTFATIQRILVDLGFQVRSVPGSHVLFERPGTDTWVLLRPYQDDDVVWGPNVVGIRELLDAKGILPAERFDELVKERSLAG
jgi:hypothetical protein